jgi:hypothetical protein
MRPMEEPGRRYPSRRDVVVVRRLRSGRCCGVGKCVIRRGLPNIAGVGDGNDDRILVHVWPVC